MYVFEENFFYFLCFQVSLHKIACVSCDKFKLINQAINLKYQDNPKSLHSNPSPVPPPKFSPKFLFYFVWFPPLNPLGTATMCMVQGHLLMTSLSGVISLKKLILSLQKPSISNSVLARGGTLRVPRFSMLGFLSGLILWRTYASCCNHCELIGATVLL